MRRYLIVANQTLGGTALDRAVQERLTAQPCAFYVLVPLVEPELEAQVWLPADPAFAVPASRVVTPEAMDEARRRSEHRLAEMVARLEAIGADASGEVGRADPVAAVDALLERESFDEVIVSTLPAGLSRWLRLDTPSRIERLVDIPVVTVIADD